MMTWVTIYKPFTVHSIVFQCAFISLEGFLRVKAIIPVKDFENKTILLEQTVCSTEFAFSFCLSDN